MKNRNLFCALLSLVLLGLSAPASAQNPQLGTKVPAFQLLATDDQFYGIKEGEDKVSVLFLMGHTWVSCLAAGPAFEQQVYQVHKNNPNVQVLLLDTYNGSKLQVELYRQITGVTAPTLLNARGMNLAGARLEHVLVVDQNREVRFWTGGTNSGEFPRLNQVVEALITKNPLIALSPTRLYFGTKMEAGKSQTVEITIDNTGAGPLAITGYTAPAEIEVEPASFTVGAQEKKTVQITFAPTQAGAYSGAIVFKHTNTFVGAIEVPIQNLTIENRQAPSIGLVQQTLDMGQSEVGKTAQQTLTITNDGPGALAVSDIQSDLPGLTVSSKQFSVPAGGSKQVAVTFRPQAEGAFSGTLVIVSDDPGKGNLPIPLSGKAIFIPADPRADFDRNGTVDFPDFLLFAAHFGTRTGDARFNHSFDVTGDGEVGFSDFLIFVQSFGKPVN